MLPLLIPSLSPLPYHQFLLFLISIIPHYLPFVIFAMFLLFLIKILTITPYPFLFPRLQQSLGYYLSQWEMILPPSYFVSITITYNILSANPIIFHFLSQDNLSCCCNIFDNIEPYSLSFFSSISCHYCPLINLPHHVYYRNCWLVQCFYRITSYWIVSNPIAISYRIVLRPMAISYRIVSRQLSKWYIIIS